MNAHSAFAQWRFVWPFSEIIVERLGWVLLHSLWQFTLVALLAGIIVRALRRTSAATRYVVLVVAMGVSVGTPIATWFLQPDAADDPASRAASAPGLDQTSHSDPGQSKEPTDASSARPRLLEPTDAMTQPGPGELSDARPHRQPYAVPLAGNSLLESNPNVASPAEPSELTWSERAQGILRPWLVWIVSGWSLGVALCSLRPLLGWHTLWRLQRVGVSPASDETLSAMRRISARLGLRRAVR